ncbi:hypothetical protein PVAP13_4NG195722 [Panicum virgatum]|uniref:Uncharacterized protein n=1 Tax=Panicum virgatum TaxID=38727 RepID=A0A8T0T604_PANVG|nr:hypothetical protein PVAP13_4NG195722 [Panicum virgatum]
MSRCFDPLTIPFSLLSFSVRTQEDVLHQGHPGSQPGAQVHVGGEDRVISGTVLSIELVPVGNSASSYIDFKEGLYSRCSFILSILSTMASY